MAFKVLMDQFIFSPMLLGVFWFHSTFLSTLNVNKSIDAISKNIISSLISNWCYWPLVQFVNIGYIPNEYKVLVINLASIPWNMYVSYSVSKQEQAEKQKGNNKTKKPGKKKKKQRK